MRRRVRQRLCGAWLCGLAATAAASAAPSPSNPVPTVADPASADGETCPDLLLTLGPAFPVAASDRLLLDRAHERLDVVSGEEHSAYDLTKSQDVSLRERDTPSGGLAAGPGSPRGAKPAVPHRGSPLPAGETTLALPNGRMLSVSRLYANISMLKVGAAARDRYETFARNLLAGTACGMPIAAMPAPLRARLKPLVRYVLADAISAGRLDDYAAWVAYRPVFEAFLSLPETEDYLEIYGYRASERGAAVRDLSLLDPNRIWTFAWNAVARIFHDPDFTEFSDLSAYQRGGRLTFTLVGSLPIPGGTGNAYGFYTKAAGEVDAGAVTSVTPMNWQWRQGDTVYAAGLDLSPPSAPVAAPAGFPGARNGLVVLDVTLDPDDVVRVAADYRAYFTALGFQFGQDQAIGDVPRYVEGLIADGSLDVLVRDGHADGDDTHAMVLYPKGWSVEGRRAAGGRLDTVHIVFNLDPNAPFARIAYSDFAAAVAARYARMRRPLTYLDGSCWGEEKAWFTLGFVPATQLVEVASRSPVNFFTDAQGSAMRVVLDAIMRGQAFAALRSRLGKLPDFGSGREDQFVLPDDGRYPRASPLMTLAPRLLRREPGGDMRSFTPEGYL